MSRTSVVLADDHAVLREGLRSLIDAQPDLIVVGEAATGPDALQCVKEQTPRVLCLDLSMPGPGSGTIIAGVAPLSPRTRTLVVTMHDDPAYIRSSFAAGAAGYVLKSSPLPGLLAAIRAVAVGQRVVDPTLEQALVSTPAPVDPGRFSRRETEVLELLVQGHTHQKIADILFLSIKTVETYRHRLREKTGLKTRADFVRYGLDIGMLATTDTAEPAAK